MSIKRNIELSFCNPTHNLDFAMDSTKNLTIRYKEIRHDLKRENSDSFVLNEQELDALEDFLDKARDFMVNS